MAGLQLLADQCLLFLSKCCRLPASRCVCLPSSAAAAADAALIVDGCESRLSDFLRRRRRQRSDSVIRRRDGRRTVIVIVGRSVNRSVLQIRLYLRRRAKIRTHNTYTQWQRKPDKATLPRVMHDLRVRCCCSASTRIIVYRIDPGRKKYTGGEEPDERRSKPSINAIRRPSQTR